ncbi:related to Intrastrand cross-link recognition protein [Zygosaccharomyces bailii]|nr:related to Intrastrand cross-link recognition protein [Zygosaccharomyces bailii]
MYNSFLSHLVQKQVPSAFTSALGGASHINPATAAAAGTSFLAQPVQRYFHNNVNNSPTLMDATHPSLMQPSPQMQLQSTQTIAKKLSSTQSRIEKRKQLKKQGPKRPSSAYFLFSMSIRNELLQQYPEAKVPELSKLASARWKELSDDQKKPFYEEFRTNWDKYRVERDEYEKTLPPKRPSGPFIQFTQEIRPIVVKENPDKNLIEITKIIGERWRNLDSEKKNAYTETYKKRLKEWESCYPEEAEEPKKK